ncbi:MAG: formate dehydrogenase major subunit, partial [Gaiellaceae bacterium]|nr:formate dehydrogenase major subunit [Gaiellaceae bacterium]
MGSNMAAAHPVGFQWAMEGKLAGAKLMHVDPRFTRTSALADLHVPIRAGTDIAFLGGIVNYILEGERWFDEYVKHYTNAPVIVDERYRDTEDLDGLFSGYDEERHVYDTSSWHYAGMDDEETAGERAKGGTKGEQSGHGAVSGMLSSGEPPEEDPTLQHPRCVFQLLKKHYKRYTPERVAEICGCTKEQFVEVAEALCANSGRERTAAIVYSVGWTQHSTGVQNIRAAAIIQLLLGNIGRPGGGIVALRGHASIQGSTDLATLYNILPGYVPMPHAEIDFGLHDYLEGHKGKTGWWG